MGADPQQQVRFQEDMALVPRVYFAICPMLFFGTNWGVMSEGGAGVGRKKFDFFAHK